MRHFLRIARRLLYWGLPPCILYVVFLKIDFEQLGRILSRANWVPILVGAGLIVFVVAACGLRWHFLLRRYECSSLSIAAGIGEYWKSLAIGVLVPGSLGSDAYRVMLVGRETGRYLRGAFVIAVEKLGALFTCAVLVAVLYPLLASNHLPGEIARVMNVFYAGLAGVVAIALSVFLVRRQEWLRRLAGAFNATLEALARKVASMASSSPSEDEPSARSGLSLILSMFSPAVVLPVVALSLAVFLVVAFQAQLYFQGLGYDMPFQVNLFVTVLLLLLFVLPISFGSIGIREGAFILFYGAFGVPAETALAVSFCSLLGLLPSYAIGACLFLPGRRPR